MRIAFAGTPEFAARQCEALLTLSQHTVVVVYTQPDKPAGRGQHLQMSPVKSLAQQHDIPVEQPTTLNQAAVDIFKRYAPDVMIVAAYGLLLPAAFLAVPLKGCINVHASLLPRWRGAAPIQRAILAGDNETGITLMRMDVGLDTVNMLAKKSCPIDDFTTAAQLHDTLAAIGAHLLIDTLDDIVNNTGEVQPAGATYAQKITKAEGRITWTNSAVHIARQIRAFNSWPVAFTDCGDERIRVWEAIPVTYLRTAPPGTIMAHHPEGIIVATGEGALLITQAQLPGKKRLPLSEILHAPHPLLAVGKTLG